MDKVEMIVEQIDKLREIDNTKYLKEIMYNNIDNHVIEYFAHDDLSKNPYRQWISKAVLSQKRNKLLNKQLRYMLYSTIAAIISVICAIITIFYK